MRTKLTLRIEEELIQKAKFYSEQTGKSVSQMVADYFALLFIKQKDEPDAPLPPVTSALRGILRGSDIQEEDYRKHLGEKHK